jgi:dinuclear metal center YbgI/SA1388 family protein
MTRLTELVNYLDQLLDVASFDDYAPNGLQVEGHAEVNIIVSGVTASQALLEAAVASHADAVIVHHGYFWRGEDPCITGIKQQRLRQLLTNGISLLAYHLPLDAHRLYGNNVQLANQLGFSVDGGFGDTDGKGLALHGNLVAPVSAPVLIEQIEKQLGRAPLHIAGSAESIRTIGWCTGAAQGYLEQAAKLGLDAYLSGEASEQSTHIARETGIHFFAAGHHATERYGIKVLGEHLADRFGIEHRFIDVDNPV